MSILSSSPKKTLQNLVEILHDGQMGFAHAAENVKNPKLKELFSRFSLQRSQFAGKLESELLSLGEKDPQKTGGTAAGAVHRGWIDLKSAFVKEDDHAVLSEAERGEDVAKKAYKEALEEELPAPLRAIITTQAEAIQAAHDEVKALRDAAKAA
jgi:uncharacterized protein (TIGR02284 family)